MRTLILLCLLGSAQLAMAQNIDFDQIVPPDYAEELSFEGPCSLGVFGTEYLFFLV